MTGTARTAHLYRVSAGPQVLWRYLNAGVLRRAALVALVLGSALTFANQAGAVLGAGEVALLPLVLVYLMPFAVASVSQMLGARQADLEGQRVVEPDPAAESFLSTAFSHGITARAALLGLVVGSVNTLIVTTAMVLEHGRLNDVPFGLLAQAYSLPVVFGILSQALAYRRVTRRLRVPAPN